MGEEDSSSFSESPEGKSVFDYVHSRLVALTGPDLVICCTSCAAGTPVNLHIRTQLESQDEAEAGALVVHNGGDLTPKGDPWPLRLPQHRRPICNPLQSADFKH